MSDTITTFQNDNKDVEKSNLPEQASPDTTIHMHASEDEEKDVRGSILHKEKEYKTGRGKLDVKIAIEKSSEDVVIFAPNEEYIVCYDVGRQGQGQKPQDPYGQPPYGQPPYGHQPPYGQKGPYYGQQPPKGAYYGQQQAVYYYEEEALDYSDGNPDRNIFVRKVTIILLVALIVTAAFVTTVFVVPRLKIFYQTLCLPIIISSGIGLIVMSIVMPCSSCARRPPTNYICFIIVVMLQCCFCSAVTVMYKTHIVVWALLTTLIVVFVCVILACTSFDFTKWLIYVIAISVALVALSFIILISRYFFGVYSKPLHIAVTFGLTLVSVVTLIIELQMVLGGKAVELSESDYVLGAYMLYMSIVDIFLKMMELIRLIDE